MFRSISNRRERSQEFSPQFLRLVTRHPTTYLNNLKHYDLKLLGGWRIFQYNFEEEEEEDENEEDEEDEEKKSFDFSKLMAFNKSKFLQHTKELDLDVKVGCYFFSFISHCLALLSVEQSRTIFHKIKKACSEY